MPRARYNEGDPLLTQDELAWLLERGQTLRRSAGHVFFQQGELTDFVLLIREGCVKVTAGGRIVALRRKGEIVGEMAPLRRKPRSASVEAIDDVEVLRISANQWLEFLSYHPRATLAQLVAKDERIEEATQKIAESDFAVEQRLALAFVDLLDSGLGKKENSGLFLKVSQHELADLSGASLDSVKKIVRIFKDSGIIRTARQATVVLDERVLRDIAAGERTAAVR